MCCIAYSSVSTISAALLYYLFRPKTEEEFRSWWRRARYIVLLCFFQVLCAIVAAMDLFGTHVTAQWFMYRTGSLCAGALQDDRYRRYVTGMCFGFLSFVGTPLLCIWWMF